MKILSIQQLQSKQSVSLPSDCLDLFVNLTNNHPPSNKEVFTPLGQTWGPPRAIALLQFFGIILDTRHIKIIKGQKLTNHGSCWAWEYKTIEISPKCLTWDHPFNEQGLQSHDKNGYSYDDTSDPGAVNLFQNDTFERVERTNWIPCPGTLADRAPICLRITNRSGAWLFWFQISRDASLNQWNSAQLHDLQKWLLYKRPTEPHGGGQMLCCLPAACKAWPALDQLPRSNHSTTWENYLAHSVHFFMEPAAFKSEIWFPPISPRMSRQ